MICRKGNKLLQDSQAPARQAEQPLPVASAETKVISMLGQLLDRFVPQEPNITIYQKPASSHANNQLALPAPQPAKPALSTPAAAPPEALPVAASQISEAKATAAPTAQESQNVVQAWVAMY